MKIGNVELDQWVVHTSGAVGKVVWIDPGEAPDQIQVKWLNRTLTHHTEFVSVSEVMPYIGDITLVATLPDVRLELTASTVQEQPVLSFIAFVPMHVTPTLTAIYTLPDSDIDRYASHYEREFEGRLEIPSAPSTYLARKAWVMHRLINAVLLFGYSTLDENVKADNCETGLQALVTRLK